MANCKTFCIVWGFFSRVKYALVMVTVQEKRQMFYSVLYLVLSCTAHNSPAKMASVYCLTFIPCAKLGREHLFCRSMEIALTFH